MFFFKHYFLPGHVSSVGKTEAQKTKQIAPTHRAAAWQYGTERVNAAAEQQQKNADI